MTTAKKQGNLLKRLARFKQGTNPKSSFQLKKYKDKYTKNISHKYKPGKPRIHNTKTTTKKPVVMRKHKPRLITKTRAHPRKCSKAPPRIIDKKIHSPFTRRYTDNLGKLQKTISSKVIPSKRSLVLPVHSSSRPNPKPAYFTANRQGDTDIDTGNARCTRNLDSNSKLTQTQAKRSFVISRQASRNHSKQRPERLNLTSFNSLLDQKPTLHHSIVESTQEFQNDPTHLNSAVDSKNQEKSRIDLSQYQSVSLRKYESTHSLLNVNLNSFNNSHPAKSNSLYFKFDAKDAGNQREVLHYSSVRHKSQVGRLGQFNLGKGKKKLADSAIQALPTRIPSHSSPSSKPHVRTWTQSSLKRCLALQTSVSSSMLLTSSSFKKSNLLYSSNVGNASTSKI